MRSGVLKASRGLDQHVEARQQRVSLDATPIVDVRIVHDKRTPPELHGAVVEVFLVRQVETAGAAVAAGALVVACFAAACFSMAACFAIAAWVTADLVAHSPVALNSNNRCVHVIEGLRPNVTEAHVAHPLPALRSGVLKASRGLDQHVEARQ